jgi:hypothetical protein
MEMNKKMQELRELVESELEDVATVKKRVEDATRTWSPGRLLDERIPEEIARFNTHAASLQRVLDKIDEESSNLEIQPKIQGMRVAIYIKNGELTIVSRKSDEKLPNPPTDIAGSVYQCNTCGSLFLAFGALTGYCEGCPDCRSTDIRKVPIESAESETETGQ